MLLELEDTLIEPFPIDGMIVPRVRMTTWGLPEIEMKVGDKFYSYERSYPIKGHSATLPKYVASLLAEGKSPLVVERPDRFYVYTEKAPEVPPAPEPPAEPEAAATAPAPAAEAPPAPEAEAAPEAPAEPQAEAAPEAPAEPPAEASPEAAAENEERAG